MLGLNDCKRALCDPYLLLLLITCYVIFLAALDDRIHVLVVYVKLESYLKLAGI